MRGASAVVSGNDYLASYAREAGARNIHTIPTVVDTNRYTVRTDWNGQAPIVIGWMGSPSTAQYLKVMEPALHSLRRWVPYRLMVVGSDAAPVNGVPISIVKWSEQTEVASLMNFDIGVMPLFDNPWERGKCGYKLIQYMATAMPVIASSVGANKQIVDHGVNGFLCETANEWEKALGALVRDAGIRRRFGLQGRATVDQRFSLSRAADSLAQILFDVTQDDVRNRRTH
jgi:glycosyltransferase involved in cell wall biosynthesis